MLLSTLPANPFVGLRPFESDESLLFFGRGAQTAELLELLHSNHFVAVVGRSGCGKSSLIRAGLIPKLQAGFLVVDRDRWVVATMKPGDAPLRNMASAVLEAAGEEAAPGAVSSLADEMSARGVEAITAKLAPVLDRREANFLLLVDQFEEVFRFGSHARPGDDPEAEEDPAAVRGRDEAADFVSQMLALSEQARLPAYVVMTMRSDFLGDCDAFYGLPEAMNRSQYLVPRLSMQQREEAISGPVRLCGQKVTPRLLDLVRNDAGDKLDQLPVMQHAMMRTWERWRAEGAGPIDVPHYVAAGRINRALSDDAEGVLAGMNEEERLLTKLVFQSLTDTDSEGRRTRRPAHLRQLEAVTGAGREKVDEIISRFGGGGRSFLAVSRDPVEGNDLVDISHESLIRQWKTLRDWVDEEAGNRATYLGVVEASLRHAEGRGALWDDPDLKFALEWWAARRPTPAWAAQYHTPRMRELKRSEQSGQSKGATPTATPDAARAREDDADRALFSDARAFLDESRRARDQELADEERQRRRQLKLTRLITLVIFIGLLLSSGLGLYAMQKRSEAETNLAEAKRQEGFAKQQEAVARRNAWDAEAARQAEKERADAEQTIRMAFEESEAKRLGALKNAEENAKKAEDARRVAESQRQSALREKQHALDEAARADANEAEARQQAYAGDISFAQHNEEEMSKAARAARLLLESYHPKDGAGAEQTRPAGGAHRRNEAESAPRAEAAARGSKPARDIRGYEWFYLWRLTHRDVHTLSAERESPVPSLGFSPAGRVAAAHYDGTVDLWDAASGRKVDTSKPAEGEQTAGLLKTAISPADGTLAVAYDDGHVALWDGATLKEKKSFRACATAVDVLAFSQDGQSLVTGCEKSVDVWNVATLGMQTPAPTVEVPRPKIEVMTRRGYQSGAVALSPDGQRLALVSGKHEVKLWHIADGKAEEGGTLTYGSLGDEPSDYALIEVLAFSHDGGKLAGGTPEGKLILWMQSNPLALPVARELPAHDMRITSLAFSPDGMMLATGGGDSHSGSVKLWDVSPWQQRLLLDSDGESVGSLSFSPDGRTLAAGYQDGAVRLWDVSSPRGYDELPADAPASAGLRLPGASSTESRAYVVNVRFSPDRKMIGALKSDGTVALLDAASGQGLKTFAGQEDVNLLSFAFSHDGRVVATGDQAGNVALYDTASFAPLSPPFSAGRSLVYSMTFSRDDRALAAIVTENDLSLIKVWDVSSGTPNFSRKIALDSNANGASVQYAGWAFSPDGTRLAACDGQGDVVLWDIEAGRIVRQLDAGALSPGQSQAACPPFLVFSDDNSMLACGDRLWEVETGKEIRLQGGAGVIGNAAFSPDGRTLATGGDDQVVQLWSTSFSHTPLAVLKGHTGAIYTVAFSSDGSALATGGDDGIKIWRAATEAQVLEQCSSCRPTAGGH